MADESTPEVLVDDESTAEALADLKRQIADANAATAAATTRAETAERQRDEVASGAVRTATDAVSARSIAINNAIAAATHAAGEAERAYVEAMEAGQFAGAATAQRRLARAESDLRDAEQARKQHDRWVHEQQQQAQRQSQEPDRRAMNRAFLDSRTSMTRQWLTSHPEAWNEETGIAPAVLKAHNGALYNDLQPDTPAYFQFIEGELAKGAGNGSGNGHDASPPAPIRQAATAMATTRSATGQPRSNQIRLTAEQAEAAEIVYPKLPANEARARYARDLSNPLTQAQLKQKGQA